MTRILCVLTFATSISLGNLAFAQHRLVTQGNNMLAIVDAKGAVEWEMPWGGIHDIHVLANGDIMVQQGAASVVQINPKTKAIVWRYDARTTNREQGHENDPVEIHAFQPLDDAGQKLMIAESGPARIIEVNRSGQLLSETKLTVEHPHPHTDTRLVRKIAPNRYLVCHEADGTVREYEEGTGRVVWEYEVPLFGRKKRGGNDFQLIRSKMLRCCSPQEWKHAYRNRQRSQRPRSDTRKEDRVEARPRRPRSDSACMGHHSGGP